MPVSKFAMSWMRRPPDARQDRFGSQTLRRESIYLRRRVLGIIAVLNICLGAVLGLLFFLEDATRGFGLVFSNQLLLTYTPTTVLVLVVAIWRHVEFRTEILSPWTELGQPGPRTATKTVLLDYISPIRLVSFMRTIRNRHLSPILGISAFTVSKLTVLASTALFISLPVVQDAASTDLAQDTIFNGSRTTVDDFPTLNDSSIVYSAYAQRLGGRNVDSATESCSRDFSKDQKQNLDAFASLRTVLPRYQCRSIPADIILESNATDQHPEHIIQLRTSDCIFPDNSTSIRTYALNPAIFRCPPRQLSPSVERLVCNGNESNWQLLSLTDFRYTQELADKSLEASLGDSVETVTSSTAVNRTQSLACQIQYSVKLGNVTCTEADHDESPDSLGAGDTLVSENSDDDKLSGLSEADLSRLFVASLFAASDMFGNVLDGSYLEDYPNTLMKFMATTLAVPSYENLFSGDDMPNAAQSVVPAVAAAIVKKNFLQEASLPLKGTTTFLAQRLFLSTSALWLMFSGFMLMATIAMLLIWKGPRSTCPQDPDNILSAALILSQGPDAETCFRDDSKDNLLDSIKQHKFELETCRRQPNGEPQFVLRALGPDHAERWLKSTEQFWWQPLFLRPWICGLSLSLPLLAVAALEVLQHFSDLHRGFATSSISAGDVIKLDLRNLFPLCALLIATLVNSIDFNIAVLAPFRAVRREWSEASTLAPILGKLPPLALFALIRTRNWGALLSALSALTASMLTIVTSGLFTGVLQEIETNTTTTLNLVDSFDPSWVNSAMDDGNAAVLASIYETSNFTYTALAYDELALPTVDISSVANTDAQANTTWTVETSAWRASLICTTALATQFNATSSYNSRSGPSVLVEASLPLPDGCLLGGPNGTDTTIDFTASFKFSMTTNSSSVGKLLDLHTGPFDSVTQLSSDELDPTKQKDNPPGCPSLAFVYGFANINNATDSLVNLLMCSQHLDTVPTSVNYALDDSRVILSPRSPPPSIITDPSSPPTPILASQNGALAFPFRPQLHLDRRLAIFNQTKYDSRNSNNSPVDPFFQAVLFGRRSVPEDYLASTVPEQQLALQSAIQGVYRRYMAQAISAKMRVLSPANGTNAEQQGSKNVVTATQTTRTLQLRIVQSRPSKIVLQVLLSLIVAGMAAALYLTEFRKVVMHNPCCFAGMAALWAGSSFVKEVGRDVLFMSEEQVAKVMEGWEFRLGWWDDDLVVGGKRRRRWGMEGRRKVGVRLKG